MKTKGIDPAREGVYMFYIRVHVGLYSVTASFASS